MQKSDFCGLFFLAFLVVLFFVACVFVLLFCNKAQKGYFPAILELFVYFVPPKGLFLNVSFLPFLFSFLVPLLSSLSKFHFFCFSSINPFLEEILCGGFWCLSFLSFPFFMVASFFETNFLASPFWNPSCFCFCLFFFCCLCFCFHGVCFCLSVLRLVLLLLCFVCFDFVFVLLSDYANSLFSLQF